MPGRPREAPDRVDVREQHANDLAEAERHDRQVVPAKPQGRQPHEVARECRGGPSCERRQKQRDSLRGDPRNARGNRRLHRACTAVQRDHRRGVRPHRHESGMADGELPGESVDQIQRHGQDHVDSAQHHDAEEVRIHHPRQERIERGEHRERRDQREHALHHTFSATLRPRIPAGRTRRITTKSTKAIASRYVGEP